VEPLPARPSGSPGPATVFRVGPTPRAMGAASPTPSPYPGLPKVEIQDCPIATSLRILGRKWTLTILRDIAFFPKAGFALIRKRNPGLRPRVLSTRLRELAREDLVRRVALPEDPRHPYYELTAKGLEVWPILAALFQFGIQHHAPRVFADARPRDLGEVYPDDAPLLLGPLGPYARGVPPVRAPPAAADARTPRSGGARAGRR